MFRIESGSLGRRIIAVLMSLYVFIAGIPYGNAPAKVECTIKAEAYNGVLANGENYLSFSAEVTVENVGRPFITSNYDDHIANINVYRLVNGEKKYLENPIDRYFDASVPQNEVIKHGQILVLRGQIEFIHDYEPGEYIVEAFVENNDKPCTATITLT